MLALGDYMGAGCYACIGGTNIRSEVNKLQAETPHIVVGTPGRVFDMLTRKILCKLQKRILTNAVIRVTYYIETINIKDIDYHAIKNNWICNYFAENFIHI